MWLEIPGQTHNTDNERVSVTMEWPREKIVQLIECYPTHAPYIHRFKRADAWHEIAENIQMERNEVDKKMMSLVTQFLRELKKCQEKKSGDIAEDAYKGQWFAFSIMLFLADKHKSHKTYDAGYQVRNCAY
ncbi:transcription factor Adf-1-like [Palaemon carinicauda]|uniref:transcription factor Adf-1-like n=1 Tax=Palaemon carinicauda TaxID=392227 RepID=UPI0035B57C79